MVIFWARCCIILFFKKKIRVALESRTLIWVPLLQAMTLNIIKIKGAEMYAKAYQPTVRTTCHLWKNVEVCISQIFN